MKLIASGTLFSTIIYRAKASALGLALLLTTATLAVQSTEAQTLTVLHAFTGGVTDGANPFAGLVRDAVGNLYGTTNDSGAGQFCPSGCGTVFSVDPSGTERILYNFAGNKDGALPYYGSLVHGTAGDLYGTTYEGGGFGAGTIFKLSETGGEKTLYSFRGRADGGFPWAGLIRDSAGNLYGTTSERGSGKLCLYGCGTVFKVDSSGKGTLLHTFIGGADGEYPLGGLVRDAAGNLYGATETGGGSGCGGSGCGTVYKVDATGKETVLYAFTGPPDGNFRSET
jgi:uncharacterized repeat protein (TIGR03803 family)